MEKAFEPPPDLTYLTLWQLLPWAQPPYCWTENCTLFQLGLSIQYRYLWWRSQIETLWTIPIRIIRGLVLAPSDNGENIKWLVAKVLWTFLYRGLPKLFYQALFSVYRINLEISVGSTFESFLKLTSVKLVRRSFTFLKVDTKLIENGFSSASYSWRWVWFSDMLGQLLMRSILDLVWNFDAFNITSCYWVPGEKGRLVLGAILTTNFSDFCIWLQLQF